MGGKGPVGGDRAGSGAAGRDLVRFVDELRSLCHALAERLHAAGDDETGGVLYAALEETEAGGGARGLEAVLVLRSALISTRNRWDDLEPDIAARTRSALRRAKTVSIEGE